MGYAPIIIRCIMMNEASPQRATRRVSCDRNSDMLGMCMIITMSSCNRFTEVLDRDG
jgi:hypothetical protein